jgi:hypothetical protein
MGVYIMCGLEFLVITTIKELRLIKVCRPHIQKKKKKEFGKSKKNNRDRELLSLSFMGLF